VIEGVPASLIGIRERNKLSLTEKKVMELIITISKKKAAMKTASAHRNLLKRGRKISGKSE
jgi:hypothetical protein